MRLSNLIFITPLLSSLLNHAVSASSSHHGVSKLSSRSRAHLAPRQAAELSLKKKCSDHVPKGWVSLGCFKDARVRLLGTQMASSGSNTPGSCIAACANAGYTHAGTEYRTQCFCGTPNYTPQALSDSSCSDSCPGDMTQTCGGTWALNLYHRTSTTSGSSTSSSITSSSTGTPAFTPTYAAPASRSSKYVFAHHMVGNTYPYKQSDWAKDIALAKAAGIDAFALNIGTDSWQPQSVAYAYAAAAAAGNAFKLFFSFDMTVFPCSELPTRIEQYVLQYASHPNQFLYKSRVFISTFFGDEQCGKQPWVNFKSSLASQGVNIFFAPAFFGTDWKNWGIVDSILAWGSGWTTPGQSAPNTAHDSYYMSQYPSQLYFPTVAALFYTHYCPNTYNKNWLFQSDQWAFDTRWKQVIAMRDKVDFLELLTWNDYGESSYLGPIAGAQPNSQAWVDGIDHQALQQANSYYASAFKNGAYPTITKFKVYLQARPHVNSATPNNDPCPVAPTVGDNGSDGRYVEINSFFTLVFAPSAAIVTMTSGSQVSTVSISAGISSLSSPLQAGSGMRVTVVVGGRTILNYSPSGWTFSATTQVYNYNYHFFSSG